MSSLAFLGLGLMGANMAARLLAAGHTLTVYNRSAAKAAPLAAAGARVAATPREAAAGAEIIFSMVADDAASRALWLGADGALAGAAPGAIGIESSTISVGLAQELAAAAAARGCGFLDAPVTGSKVEAGNGGLKFLVGGDAATLEKVRPVLAAMSQAAIHLGPAGSGALLKLVNNSLNGVHVAAFAEALALLEKTGIDLARAVDVITNGANGSPIVKTVAPRMTAQNYTPNFAVNLLSKDLRYALAEGRARNASLRIASAALGLLEKTVTNGDGDLDMAAVAKTTRADVHA